MLDAISKLAGTVRKRIRQPLEPYLYSRRSYSQEGEDLVLLRLFEGTPVGVYVDVGAHHPFRFSNTCLLHNKGWKGINIDAMPGSMAVFRRWRPKDVNLEVGVSDQPSQLQFFIFQEPALNTFDESLANDRMMAGWRLKERRTVTCEPLASILERELPHLGAHKVDLLNVDVEGLDLLVLRSNDWQRFRPRALVVEILDQDVERLIQSEIASYCASIGYVPFAKLHHSVIFVSSQ